MKPAPFASALLVALVALQWTADAFPAQLGGRADVARGIAANSATLRLVSASPLIVAGVGFASRERVTVTALTSVGPRVVRTRATERGTFRALLGRFAQPCGKPFAVRARGGHGSSAVLRLEAPPCVPPPPG